MWRPDDWFNPFEFLTLTLPQGHIGIDILIAEDGEKLPAKDRDRYFKTFEAGADAVLSSLAKLRMRDVVKIIDKIRTERLENE